MENKTAIAMVVFSVALLLSIDYHRSAYAQTATNFDFTLNGTRNQCDIMKGILDVDGSEQHTYACIPDEPNDSSHTFSYFSSNTNPPTVTTIEVFPQQAGCDPINNPCNSDGGSASGNTLDRTGESGKTRGLWCGITDCFTLWVSSTSHSHQLIRITPSLNDVTGYLNITSSRELRPLLTGIDFNTGGIGGINVYYIRCDAIPCLTSSTSTLVRVGGTAIMGTTGTVAISQFFKGDNTATNGWGIFSMDICWFCDGNTTNNTNNKLIIIASRQGATTNRAIDIVRGDLMTVLTGGSNSAIGLTTSQNTAIARFLNGSRWIIATDANVYTLTRTSVVISSTTSYATLGLSNHVSNIITNTTQTETDSDPSMHSHGGVYWVQHGNSSSLTSLTQVNATTLNTLVNFDSSTGNTISTYIGQNPIGGLITDPYSHTILRTDINNRAQIIFLSNFADGGDGDGGGAGSQNGVCLNVDANGDGKFGTVLDCIGDRSTIQSVTGGRNLTDVSNDLFCGLGIVQTFCTNDNNVKTNGTGIILMLITGGLFAGITLSTIGIANSRFGAGISYTEIPKEFWLFLVVGVITLAWYLGWIEDLVFLAMAVGIAGLFSFGLYKHLRGG